jgi:hypothetical protein
MSHRLQTPEGKKLYALRKQIPEPVFGIIKSVMGFRQFLLRGLHPLHVPGHGDEAPLTWRRPIMDNHHQSAGHYRACCYRLRVQRPTPESDRLLAARLNIRLPSSDVFRPTSCQGWTS